VEGSQSIDMDLVVKLVDEDIYRIETKITGWE